MNELYLRQMLAGRDFARDDPGAASMANFAYAIGSRSTRECVLVDPAWDVQGLLDRCAEDGMRVVGALATHYHPDHVGGDLFGHSIEGAARFVELAGAKVSVHGKEADGVRAVTGLSASDLHVTASGDRMCFGSMEIQFLHTPGHTPGSQCFLVNGEALVSGDTLFVEGCGRVDLPGGDPEEMYRTLSQRLAKLDGSVVLYPGHHYGAAPTATFDELRAGNPYLRAPDLRTWLRMMG